MTTHVREQIRSAFALELSRLSSLANVSDDGSVSKVVVTTTDYGLVVSAATSAGDDGGLSDESKVSNSRRFAVSSIPSIVIFTAHENPETSSRFNMALGSSGRVISRELPLRIEIFAPNQDNCESLVREAEIQIANSSEIPPLVKDCFLSSTEFEYSEGEKMYVVATLEYRVNYHTSENNPTVAV